MATSPRHYWRPTQQHRRKHEQCATQPVMKTHDICPYVPFSRSMYVLLRSKQPSYNIRHDRGIHKRNIVYMLHFAVMRPLL